MDVGLLDHRSQRLLRHPSRLQKAREVAASAQLRYTQLDRSCTCVPVAIAVAVTQVGPVLAALAVAGAAQRLGLQFHQPLCGEADHLAQQRRVRTLLQQLAKGDHVVGHRGVSKIRVALVTQPYPGAPR